MWEPEVPTRARELVAKGPRGLSDRFMAEHVEPKRNLGATVFYQHLLDKIIKPELGATKAHSYAAGCRQLHGLRRSALGQSLTATRSPNSARFFLAYWGTRYMKGRAMSEYTTCGTASRAGGLRELACIISPANIVLQHNDILIEGMIPSLRPCRFTAKLEFSKW